ncbi:SpvB/TcaC N-terminal domain-containing protein [Haliscomenobacter hydrossis]|uniref:RHS repeat-associated core domain protein n=1 Tax=Haliscomenobacter hydrossis (strain ATCC 27775 / DSM 1100 / LMG 10767 / O) TaxID=760192 RepID=F4KSF9_HALH1|nr:SpvB/TcaC N-terminal domain-containing protein [Haliscomenobacter hydrossis]AEE53362.1 RHS repeat-associated core domain protein [Haliscomenobacter hydrossis DSM 1100]
MTPPGNAPKQTDQRSSNAASSSAQGSGKDSFSIQVPQISLPKGGGAIKGIDEKFEVNAANGTASFSLPLPFSPARNGFMPAIALGYNSGAGNGVFGLGWDLGFPSIQRKTDKQLPRYRDDEDSDVFMFSGAEDLVPYLKANGTIDEFPSGDYFIRRYRPRIEAGFARIEKITHKDRGVWWKVTTRENVVTFFGKTTAYRIADPLQPTHVFQWLPELSYDDKGNCVLYEFKVEDGAGYGTELYDANRFTPDQKPLFTNRYLKRVHYCPKAPFLPKTAVLDELYHTTNPAAHSFWMELVLDYGEHGSLPSDIQGTAVVQHTALIAWPGRHDAFSTYRAGFEIRTARLCKRVLMFHHFEQLGDQPCLVRSLDLQYRDWKEHKGAEQGKKMEVTYLVAATQRSYIRESGTELNYRYRALPPVEFGYEELEWKLDVHRVTSDNLANAPVGLSSGYQWVDLYNEGIAGIFTEQAEGWFYKENLGQGEFTPAKPVIPKPSFTGMASGVLQLQDLAADGRKQVVVNSPGLNGYFELTDDNDWTTFQAFEKIPNVDLRDPNTRLLDLNGDGQPEIVITEENVFSWYPAAGTLGYDSPELAPKPFDEEQGPAIVFADSTQSIFLANLSGDGLTDIARIRNGEVCYWPNLGYGRFGAKVTMLDSPWFDLPDQFDPSYLQLADISGTGATDILYLGKKQFRAWLNLSGNAWSEPCEIDPFLDLTPPNQVSVTDFLGNGTSCIVWSSPLPAEAAAPLRYIDLMGGKKPHILNSYTNNLGKTTTWTYRSSTHYYLQDKKAGQPWITKLPFPVQVVSSVSVEDKWRNTRFSNAYSYHHGYYDHPEREFRGFGRVEQTDVEDFGKFEAGNINSPYITADKTLYQPPIKTITWYHTGAFLSRERILNQFEQEYFRPNGGDFQENVFPEPDLEILGLSADEYREALRACKGMPLRTETYELRVDDEWRVTQERLRLYSTAFHNCHIKRLQPRAGNVHSVFLVAESEAITYHYELDLQQSELQPDPRIAHTLNLDIDELGNVLQSVAVGYPRWPNEVLDDQLLTEEAGRLIQDVQNELHIVYTENRFTDDAITPQDYRLRMPCEVKTYELSGIAWERHAYFALNDFLSDQLLDLTPTAYHLQPDTGLQKRLVEHMRMLYFADDLKTSLAFGELNRLGLPYETYKIALTRDLLTAVLGGKLPSLQQAGEAYAAMLIRVLAEGGYHQFPGEPNTWWICSGIAGFEDDAADHFYLPECYFDPFGEKTTLTFDQYDLFMERSEDPLGNRVEVLRFDYRVLAPLEMRDINGNLSEVAFDVLGVPAAMAVKGKGTEGDSVGVTQSHPDTNELITFFTGNYDENKARELLGTATARHIYYLGETIAADGSILYAQHPACAAGILREKHVAQLGENETSQIQVAFEYSDGSGAVIAAKAQAEPAPGSTTLRWITNGKTVLNNKGKPVKQYEPYFCESDHRFEEPREVGVTPVIYYDAAGRTVRTEMPDGTFSRVEFSPWHFQAYDANDTVLESQWFVDQGGDHAWITQPPESPSPRQRATYLATIHANTSAETHLDSLGREVVAIAHNRWRKHLGNDIQIAEEKYLTYTKLDAEGKPLWLRDARGNYVMVYARVQNPEEDFQNMDAVSGYVPAYDIAGNLLFQHSNEAGDRWMLPDATAQPMYVWDANEYAGTLEQRLLRTEYDALRRPTRQWLRINSGAEKEIGRTLYGEGLPNAQADNLRGQAVVSLGPEGCTQAVRVDFKGNLLESRRQLLADAQAHTLDWRTLTDGVTQSHPVSSPLLSTEAFTQSTQYDALNRMIRLENWHLQGREPAIYTPSYNRRGVLESETLSVRGQVTQAIRHIEYDAKGQRTRIQYGNDTTTRYTYDPNTFRLTHLLTTAKNGRDKLQDLHYTYDPSGNISEIRDDAYEPVFFRNQRVEPRSQYEYDALYRLIEATGRENYRANGAPKGYGQVEDMPTHNFGSTDNALRNYTQRYEYDPAGNFITLQHLADGGGWTRHYETEAQSNRLTRTWLGTDTLSAVTYRYDTHGSMLNFANVNVAQNNRWDFRDMIHTLDLEGGGRAYYQYDAGKQRTRKYIVRLDGSTEERIYLGGYEWYRRIRAGVVLEEIETNHLFADDQRVLIVEEVLRTNNNNLRTGLLYRYQYSNHLGSVGLELDADSAIISYEEYHPYGTTAYQAKNGEVQAAAKRYRYTGMERDEESGLAYHTARYYAAWLGRWGSCDPIGVEGGANLYVYAKNSPIYLMDTNGKQPSPVVQRILSNRPLGNYSSALANPSTTSTQQTEVGQNSVEAPSESSSSWTPGRILGLVAAVGVGIFVTAATAGIGLIAASMLAGAAAGAAGELVEAWIDDRPTTLTNVIISAGIGAAFGALFAGAGRFFTGTAIGRRLTARMVNSAIGQGVGRFIYRLATSRSPISAATRSIAGGVRRGIQSIQEAGEAVGRQLSRPFAANSGRQATLREALEAVRTDAAIRHPGRSGVQATLQGELDGQPFFASTRSGIDRSGTGVNAIETPTGRVSAPNAIPDELTPHSVPSSDGRFFPRNHDAEFKLFGYTLLNAGRTSTGQLYLGVTAPMCPGCYGNLWNTRAAIPGLNLIVDMPFQGYGAAGAAAAFLDFSDSNPDNPPPALLSVEGRF